MYYTKYRYNTLNIPKNPMEDFTKQVDTLLKKLNIEYTSFSVERQYSKQYVTVNKTEKIELNFEDDTETKLNIIKEYFINYQTEKMLNEGKSLREINKMYK